MRGRCSRRGWYARVRKTTSQVVTTDHANDGLIAVTHGGRTSRIVGENHAAVDGIIRHVVDFGVDLIRMIARPVDEENVVVTTCYMPFGKKDLPLGLTAIGVGGWPWWLTIVSY